MDLGNDMRHVLEQGWYKEVFPQTRIKSDNQAHLETTKMGSRVSTSVGGGANTGLGAQIIIIDIAHNACDENSCKPYRSLICPALHENTTYRYTNTIRSGFHFNALGNCFGPVRV